MSACPNNPLIKTIEKPFWAKWEAKVCLKVCQPILRRPARLQTLYSQFKHKTGLRWWLSLSKTIPCLLALEVIISLSSPSSGTYLVLLLLGLPKCPLAIDLWIVAKLFLKSISSHLKAINSKKLLRLIYISYYFLWKDVFDFVKFRFIDMCRWNKNLN